MFKKTNSINLELFRVVLGVCLLVENIRLFRELGPHFVEPDFLFQFDYAGFIQPLPQGAMQALLAIMLIACVGIIIKKYYKAALLTYLLGYTYFFLLDVSLYNNHYYLLILVLAILLVIPQEGGLRQLKTQGILPQAPEWGIWLLRFQLGVAYFYGGIAKLNGDWLGGDVMRAVFAGDPDYIPPFLPLGADAAAMLYTHGGWLFDLLVVPLLLFKKTRWLAFAALLFFHLSNAFSLDIGVFPYFMIGAAVLFWDGEEFLPLLRKMGWLPEKLKRRKEDTTVVPPMLKAGLAVYIALQLLVPLRHYAIPNNVDWTGQGKLFSWRMKMPHKKYGQIQIHTFDKASGEQLVPKVNIAPHQVNALVYHPLLLPQFLDELAANLGKSKAELDFKVNVQTSMNGRPMQAVYDSSKDFGKMEKEIFSKNDWVSPLE